MRTHLSLIWIGFKAALAGVVVWAASWMGAGLSLAASGGIAAAASFLLAVRWGGKTASLMPGELAALAALNSAYVCVLLGAAALDGQRDHADTARVSVDNGLGLAASRCDCGAPGHPSATCSRGVSIHDTHLPMSARRCRHDHEVVHQ